MYIRIFITHSFHSNNQYSEQHWSNKAVTTFFFNNNLNEIIISVNNECNHFFDSGCFQHARGTVRQSGVNKYIHKYLLLLT